MNSGPVLRAVDKKHFVVTCAICGENGEWCPRRTEMLGGPWRAVEVFKRAGWAQVPPKNHHMRQRAFESAMAEGKGERHCRSCAPLARRTRSA